MAPPDPVYPQTPAVPPGLTEPSQAYRRHAYLAVIGLLAFIGVYVGLTSYFGWLVYRLFAGAFRQGGNPVAVVFSAAVPTFFFLLLARGLFAVKRGGDRLAVEVTAAQQPQLFAFLHRIADEAHAPRPNRVFLSPRVNASVFYDVSFVNLLFPSKKNLELGLGLVNMLSLDELKAVLAHEFGHFAQRTMAVGRWAYTAEQVAGHVIARRGNFDRLLGWLSTVDLRVAWIGWILRVLVWSVRALLDTVFRLVVLAERALGREMEFQADKVAVSVSGSDSLVHALARLGPADEAWGEAAEFLLAELNAGRAVDDLFTLQTRAQAHLAHVLGEPKFGQTPAAEQRGPGGRVFQQALAQPPRMWLTHPPNHEREENAKRLYVPSPLDERSAWVLFADAPGVRRQVTQAFVTAVVKEGWKPSAPADEPAALARLDERYRRPALAPEYRGAYLARAMAAYEASSDGLLRGPRPHGPDDVRAALAQLYPVTLRGDVAAWRERREEEALLEGLRAGVLTAPGNVVRYRGREVRRRDLPALIAEVKAERQRVEEALRAHDVACRAAHLGAARLVGQGWPEHLEGLVRLLHWATHALRDVADADALVENVVAIAVADGRVSSDERGRIVEACRGLYVALQAVWAAKKELRLPPDVETRFTAAGGFTALEEDLGLNVPSETNVGDWLDVRRGWLHGARADLEHLSQAALDALLAAEATVASWAREGVAAPEAAPPPAVAPQRYPTCCVGAEREKQKKLGWWDRFQTADGVVPGTARAVVASAMLAPALFAGSQVGQATVHVVNGLGVPVLVKLGGKSRLVVAHGIERLEVPSGAAVPVSARLVKGGAVLEERVEDLGAFSDEVFNVAGAAVLFEWTATYGSVGERPPRVLGNPHWLDATQDAVFTSPPDSIKGSGTRTVLETLLDKDPGTQLSALDDDAAARDLALIHVAHEPADSPALDAWLDAAPSSPGVLAVLERRAAESVGLERALLQESTPEDERRRCQDVAARAQAPGAAEDLHYLAWRCSPEADAAGPARTASLEAVLEAHPHSPWLRWAWANDLARRSRWADAFAAWSAVTGDKALALVHRQSVRDMLRAVRVARALEPNAHVPPTILSQLGPSWLTASLGQRAEAAPTAHEPGFVGALRSLNSGRLAEATQRAVALSAPERDYLVTLVGASQGAEAVDVARARALGPTARGMARLWLAALALRSGEPDAAKELLADSPLQAEVVAALVPALQAKDARAYQALVDEHARSVSERATLLALGAVALGERAPAAWATYARAGLFADERPHL